jgi:hypothetical protein
MWTDPIVEEIHQIRLEHAQKFKFDLHAIYQDLKKHENANSQRVVALPIKRQQPTRNGLKLQEVLGDAA